MNARLLHLGWLSFVLYACPADLRFSADADAGEMQDSGSEDSPDGGNAVCQCLTPFPLCAAGGRCAECLSNAECAAGLCDPPSGRCAVPCNRDTDICDQSIYPRGCRDDFGAARCTACKEQGDCGGHTPRCATGRGVCVQCLSDSDCDASRPICDIPRGECVP